MVEDFTSDTTGGSVVLPAQELVHQIIIFPLQLFELRLKIFVLLDLICKGDVSMSGDLAFDLPNLSVLSRPCLCTVEGVYNSGVALMDRLSRNTMTKHI